jgi:hypothetical protein
MTPAKSTHFSEELSNQIKQSSWQLHLSIKPPEILYHYTNLDATIKILKNKQFWATDIQYMNDASETEYARKLILNAFDKKSKYLRQQGTKVPHIRRFLALTSAALQEPQTYICCFCESKEFLSQWRAYGHLGTGCALGIEATGFADPSLDVSIRLRKIEYKRQRQEDVITDFIDRICTALNLADDLGIRDDSVQLSDWSKQFHSELDNAISDWLVCFKNPIFQEEREWRLVCQSRFFSGVDALPFPLQFRPGTGMVVPYLEIPFAIHNGNTKNKPPIREIVYGGNLRHELTKKALDQLLETQGYPDVRVERSIITTGM